MTSSDFFVPCSSSKSGDNYDTRTYGSASLILFVISGNQDSKCVCRERDCVILAHTEIHINGEQNVVMCDAQ